MSILEAKRPSKAKPKGLGSNAIVRLRWRSYTVARQLCGFAHLVADNSEVALCGFVPHYYWQGENPYVATDRGRVPTRRKRCHACSQANAPHQATAS
jgi:hypothetical protein